jgi:hypothetical protein
MNRTFLVLMAVGLGFGGLRAEGQDAASSAKESPFGVQWIQNHGYWNSGRAEFNTYTAKIVRYGQPRECEVIHILVREPFAGSSLVKADNAEAAGAYSVLKLNQILEIPTGVYVYQQMHSSFWRVEDAALVKFSLTSNDSCGNTFKLGERTVDGAAWRYRYFTYWEGMSEGEELLPAAADKVLYDELPARVRMLDFSKSSGTARIQLVPSMINSKKGATGAALATLSWKQDGEAFIVTLEHAGGTDVFTLKAKFPFLLERWKQADGGELVLKTALKVDYWNFNKPGDKESVLGNPAFFQR